MMPSPQSHYLAVDAGGTKADLILATDDTVLARVQVGSIKILNTPPDEAEANFASALEQLERATGVLARHLTRTCIGTSGFSVPSVLEWLRKQHEMRAGGELILCGDEEIALDAAFHGGRGVLALAGTGSNVIGRTADARRVRAGGWGPVLGDEGSGHWIGLRAVRAIFHSIDERRSTMLQDAILDAWQLESLQQLIQLGNSADLRIFAELTPVVVRCADTNDEVALKVLESAGSELARLIELVVRQMQEMEAESAALPEVALAGSILRSIPAVRTSMGDALHRVWPEIVVHTQSVDPVMGALWRARHPNTTPQQTEHGH
jgi:N-acetylglucosamine kinase-like BadF-type ATPase